MSRTTDWVIEEQEKRNSEIDDSEYFKKDTDEREYLERRGGTSIRAYQVEDRILDRDPRN